MRRLLYGGKEQRASTPHSTVPHEIEHRFPSVALQPNAELDNFFGRLFLARGAAVGTVVGAIIPRRKYP